MTSAGKHITVFAACLTGPVFQQEEANATHLCSNEFSLSSVCNLGDSSAYAGCFCEYEELHGFFWFPTCDWKTVTEDGDEILTTTVITSDSPETTSFAATTTSQSIPFQTSTIKPTTFQPTTFQPTTFQPTTFQPTTFQAPTNPLNCNTSNVIQNGELLCEGTLCEVNCDPGFAPHQLKASDNPFPKNVYCSDAENINIHCIPIQEICELDTLMFESDPRKTVNIVSRCPHDDILGGLVRHVSCESGYVLELTGNTFERLRCVCKLQHGWYICRRSDNFQADLGECVVAEPNFQNGFVSPEVIAEMSHKQHKFSYFLRSLYDTFWYENN